MMKSRKKNSPIKGAGTAGLADPELEYIPREEEPDPVGALLRQVADRDNHESAGFAYPEAMEKDDCVDREALHRIVEDLQFGHDLRL